MTLAHLVFAAVTTIYILLAIQFEEADLVAEHGIAYETYRYRVPMLVPGAPRPTTHLAGTTPRSLARKG
jgi:methanethiol S-methyltransferase